MFIDPTLTTHDSGEELAPGLGLWVTWATSSDLDVILKVVNSKEAPRAAVELAKGNLLAHDGCYDDGMFAVQVKDGKGKRVAPQALPPEVKDWFNSTNCTYEVRRYSF